MLGIEQQDDLATEYLPWSQRFLREKLGDEGEGVAHAALAHLIRVYDTTTNVPFEAYLRQYLYRAAVSELRLDHGRAGTKKYEMRGAQTSLDRADDSGRSAGELIEDDDAAAPDASLQHWESMRKALLLAETLPPAQRPRALGAVLGDLPPAVVDRAVGDHVADVGKMVDALLLAGASLQARPQSVRLVVERRGRSLGLLAYAVIVAETAGMRCRLSRVSVDAGRNVYRIRYASAPHPALPPLHARWYPAGVQSLPADLVLTRPHIAYWLTRLLASDARPQASLALWRPLIPPDQVARRVAEIQHLSSLACALCEDAGGWGIRFFDRQAIAAYVGKVIPRCVWGRQPIKHHG